MKPTIPLKLYATAFTVLWTGWMLLWSGSNDPANTVILLSCGSAAGFAWYFLMRWSLQAMNPPPRRSANAGARR